MTQLEVFVCVSKWLYPILIIYIPPEAYVHTHTHIYIYMYMYMYIYVYMYMYMYIPSDAK